MKSAEAYRSLGDPPNLKKRGKNASQRRGRYNPGWTPTEQRVREKLLRQFIKRFDGPCGNSDDYRKNFDSMIDPATGKLRP